MSPLHPQVISKWQRNMLYVNINFLWCTILKTIRIDSVSGCSRRQCTRWLRKSDPSNPGCISRSKVEGNAKSFTWIPVKSFRYFRNLYFLRLGTSVYNKQIIWAFLRSPAFVGEYLKIYPLWLYFSHLSQRVGDSKVWLAGLECK